MEASKELLAGIKEKLQVLFKEQAQMAKENDRLRHQVATQQTAIAELHEKNEALEQQVDILKTAAGQMDDKSKKQFEKRINHYLKDIDAVIAHLDQ